MTAEDLETQDTRTMGGLDGPIVLGVVLLTLLHWVTLALRLPLAQSLRGWFLGYSTLPFGIGWPIPVMILLVIGAGWSIFRGTVSTRATLIGLVGLGFALQLGLASLEGRGLDALRDPLVRIGGHGEMFDVSIAEPSLLEVARNYEAYSASDRLMHYAQSKPPGFLLVYMATERLATRFGHPVDDEARKQSAATLAAVGWSLISFLAVLPLFWFSKLFSSERDALVVCLMYLVVPSVQLINGHLDQVLFPTLAMLVLALFAQGVRSGSKGMLVGAGGCIALSLFVSFSLLPVLPLIGVVLLAERWRSGTDAPGWLSMGTSLLWFGVGAVAVQIALALWVDYDPISRFRSAMIYHANWKSLPFDLRTVVYTSLLNLIEFGTWLGVPLGAAWLAGSLVSLSRFLRREEQPIDAMMLGMTLVVLAMCAFGRTMAEVARLWMFLVPLVCFLAVSTVRRVMPADANRVLVGAIALQGITVLFLKRFCDI